MKEPNESRTRGRSLLYTVGGFCGISNRLVNFRLCVIWVLRECLMCLQDTARQVIKVEMKALMSKRPFVTNKKLPFLKLFSPFLHRDECETRETRKWLVMKRKGPWEWEKWELKTSRPFSPCRLPLRANFQWERDFWVRGRTRSICYKTTSLTVSPSCPHAQSCYPDVLRGHPLYQCTT